MKSAIQHNHAFAQTCPHLLKTEQLQNPFLVITEFFSRLPLGQYRKELDIWFSAALHEKLKHPDPETLYYFYQELQILLNALYLLAQKHKLNSDFLLSGATYAQLLSAGKLADTSNRFQEAYAQPYWLPLADREKSLDFLKKTMTLENTVHIRQGLQHWLESALSKHECLANTHKSYSFELYSQLHQIIEASYLILPQVESKHQL